MTKGKDAVRYFFSVGEPSGDLHAANLIAALQALDPQAECSGFGGDLMERAGCELLYKLADQAIMGIGGVVKALPLILRLLGQTKQHLASWRPDVVILVDYPGFNWQVAKIAKQLDIPVHYYCPPQIWAWATWRVRRMRANVDRVYCCLPFEETWFRKRGVHGAEYVGHPYFDELTQRRLDDAFLENQRGRDLRKVVALLPGSRTREVHQNVITLVRSARKIAENVPNSRFLVAGFKEKQRPMLEKAIARSGLNIEVHVGRTPEIIQLADAAVSVSGSVSLELLYHCVPTTIIYHLNPLYDALRSQFLRVPYITLVNLIANRELFPECVGWRDLSTQVAETVCGWLSDKEKREQLRLELEQLKSKHAQPGATYRAAQMIHGSIAEDLSQAA
ncbi:Glycosyl transferase [Planctomycetes bacterium Pan216]|uniref:Lipid-A-disaccharide synthase n=1 Tax=Kolteria novifilia TaxID=2527975 RepID=A0A518B2E6_9BACT|nr:Glycosyl transferase [Planctomycetes bacterium Pan216]